MNRCLSLFWIEVNGGAGELPVAVETTGEVDQPCDEGDHDQSGQRRGGPQDEYQEDKPAQPEHELILAHAIAFFAIAGNGQAAAVHVAALASHFATPDGDRALSRAREGGCSRRYSPATSG